MATTTYPTQDSQKGKLYAAERSTEWTTKASELISEAEVTALATKACKWLYSKGYRPCTTHPTVAFPGNGRGGAWASRGQRKLSFTPAARKRWVVLHEVAHLVLPSNHPEYDGDDRPHGWCFADVYLKLVSRFCGRSNANALLPPANAGQTNWKPRDWANACFAKRRQPECDKGWRHFVPGAAAPAARPKARCPAPAR